MFFPTRREPVHRQWKLSQLIQESYEYRPSLPVFHTGHHFFSEKKSLEYLQMHFCGWIDIVNIDNFRVKKVKLAMYLPPTPCPPSQFQRVSKCFLLYNVFCFQKLWWIWILISVQGNWYKDPGILFWKTIYHHLNIHHENPRDGFYFHQQNNMMDFISINKIMTFVVKFYLSKPRKYYLTPSSSQQIRKWKTQTYFYFQHTTL